jgi:cation transport ATPase
MKQNLWWAAGCNLISVPLADHIIVGTGAGLADGLWSGDCTELWGGHGVT